MVLESLRREPQVVGAAPYVMSQGLLTTGGAVKGVMIRGIDPAQENQVTDFAQAMVAGKLQQLKPGEFGLVLGQNLADELGVTVGDKLSLITPQGSLTPAGLMPRLKQFSVVGLFRLDMYEYDSGLALLHLNDSQKLFRMADGVSGVRVKLRDLFDAPRFASELVLPTANAYVRDWTRSHSNYFEAVALEKRMMFIILTIIVMVAAFNLVSTLVMTVTDKQADIAILRTMGATPGLIQRIFLVQGCIIGVVGTALGVLGGLLIAWNIDVIVPFIEKLVGQSLIPGAVYMITQLPAEVHIADVLSISVTTLLMSFFMTLYPSWRAARVAPAEALRYE
jgi:lipoprotein-releasing system permease protein